MSRRSRYKRKIHSFELAEASRIRLKLWRLLKRGEPATMLQEKVYPYGPRTLADSVTRWAVITLLLSLLIVVFAIFIFFLR